MQDRNICKEFSIPASSPNVERQTLDWETDQAMCGMYLDYIQSYVYWAKKSVKGFNPVIELE